MTPLIAATPIGGMLFFKTLACSKYLDGVFALAYRFTDNKAETWTQLLTQFKQREQSAVRGACAVLPEVVARTNTLPASDRIVLTAAIPADCERLPAAHPLRQLGAALANRMTWEWRPNLLSKKKHRRLIDLTTAEQRDREVANVYAAQQVKGTTLCVILDDLVTRGATLNDAARAIKKANRKLKLVYGVVLGKNERVAWATKQGCNLGNGHLPDRLLRLWERP